MKNIFSYQKAPEVVRLPYEKFGEDAVHDLTKILIDYNRISTRQTDQLIILTRVITILTFLMLVGLVIQIFS